MSINPQTKQDRSKHEDVRQDDEPKVEQGTDFELHSDWANIGPLPSQHAISDPQVLRLIANMHEEVQSGTQVLRLLANIHEEVQSGCPGGKIYGEALSLALASYLLARYAKAVHVERSGITFSPAQAARVRDFIQANLTRDIALSELADLVGLSAHYFSFLFKNTFHVAPHHYLLRERIHEGQKLLVSGRLSICEVALQLGFSDQSHFTHVFRKVTGITPRRYQRSCREAATSPQLSASVMTQPVPISPVSLLCIQSSRPASTSQQRSASDGTNRRAPLIHSSGIIR